MVRALLTAVVVICVAACTRASEQSSPASIHPLGRTTLQGAAADDLVLAQLRKMGSDLSKPTDVRFYLYVPGEQNAQQAAAVLRKHAFKVHVHEPLGELDDGTYESRYSVIANMTQVPTPETLARDRTLFESLASRFKGEYDGWEAQSTKSL